MFRRFAAFAVLALPLLVACDDGGGIPNTNTVDYNVTFGSASASSSCPDDLHEEGEGTAGHCTDPSFLNQASCEGAGHEWTPPQEGVGFSQYTETYRIHFIDGPAEPRVDYYWKERGDSDSNFVFFAAGTLQGSLDQGVLDYAGGSFEETRGSDQLTYRIEGRVTARHGDTLADGVEEYIIEDSSNTADYPIGCVYTIYYDGDLAGATDESTGS